VYFVLVLFRFISTVCVLVVGVAAFNMYDVFLFSGVSAYHRYDVCTVSWCDSIS